MREVAGQGGRYMLSLPRGARIPILRTVEVGGEPWGQTQWSNGGGTHTGWVSMVYVALDADAGAGGAGDAQDGDGPPGVVTVPLTREAAVAVLAALTEALAGN
jgi:hypothetical protein